MLADGVAAFAVLLVLQYAIAWGGVRSERFQQLTSAAPTLLHHQGLLTGPMRHAGVSSEGLRQVVRSSGHVRLSDITAIALESDGTPSALSADPRLPRGVTVSQAPVKSHPGPAPPWAGSNLARP